MRKTTKKLDLPSIYTAEQYAAYLLSAAMLSAGQIAEKLKKRGYKAEDTAAVVKKFVELGFLDDAQYAQVYSENLKKYKNFGYYGIKKKLIERKLSQKQIEATLQNFTIAQERAIAKRLLEKSAAGKSFEQKYRMLQTRGFRGEVIAKVVKRDADAEFSE